MSYEKYRDYRLAPDDNGCWDILDSDYHSGFGTYPSKAAAKRAVDDLLNPSNSKQTALQDVLDERHLVFCECIQDGKTFSDCDCGLIEVAQQLTELINEALEYQVDTTVTSSSSNGSGIWSDETYVKLSDVKRNLRERGVLCQHKVN